MEKIGIALAGGGARGAYQIGAWKAIRELGIENKITAYAGASVGSLNAALYAMGDYEKAHKVWMNLNKNSLFNLEKNILKRVFREKLNFLDKGIYDTSDLEKMIDETINFEKLVGKEIYVSATVLGDQKGRFFDLLKTNFKHYYQKDNQIKYAKINDMGVEEIKKTLLASCAIPVAFKPIMIDDKSYYDGGLLENTPITPLVNAGCTKIIVIDLFRHNFQRKKEYEGVEIINVFPSHSLRGILDFSSKHIYRRFELGYEDTLKKLKEFSEEIN